MPSHCALASSTGRHCAKHPSLQPLQPPTCGLTYSHPLTCIPCYLCALCFAPCALVTWQQPHTHKQVACYGPVSAGCRIHSLVDWRCAPPPALPCTGMVVTLTRRPLAVATHPILWQALTWDDLVAAKDVAVTHLLTYWITYALVSIALALVVTRRKRSVYLLDFATYKPPVEWQVSHDKIMQLMHKIGRFNDDRCQAASPHTLSPPILLYNPLCYACATTHNTQHTHTHMICTASPLCSAF